MGVIWRVVAFILLTVVTQVGGIAMLISSLMLRRLGQYAHGWRRRAEIVAAFFASYVLLTAFVVPPLAWLGGRVPLDCGFGSENYAAANTLYCALNRNYVEPRVKTAVERLSQHMQQAYPGTITLYLDGNFPFFDGFPLIPHLSHSDGRKLDLAFYYTDPAGQYVPGGHPSPVGYWAFERPADGRGACGGRGGWLRWDVSWFRPFLADMKLDEERTRAAINWLTTSGREFGVEKLYVEPHLSARLGVGSPLIHFQGCRAARHDDHVHFQVSR